MQQTQANLQATGPLTQKPYKQLPKDNEKLTLLENQMGDLANDFEDMKRNREEAKKQLEAKFLDVHRKIQNTREFITQEGERINNTLIAYDSKFTQVLNQTNQKLQTQHETFAHQTDQRIVDANVYLKDLTQKLEEEKQERMRQSDENLREIRKQLTTLFEHYETEKNTRVEREKEILRKLDDEAYQLNEKLSNEKSERILQSKELRDHTDQEIQRQRKNNQDFHVKTIDEFNHVAYNLKEEMNQRFNQQNQIIDNLSSVIKTIQDTLKIIGKGVND
ncbi:unnamed protein product (macronuclear) [Paramecium tetraurelia]|uniref:SF-assemblin n=1 Tax=Paramecium tetraurelia TaxID=5888 RepID=A0BNI2_PARTE|nr:uncharacterized protein GSPATT00030737001 [Paramecium tetraurelia]CAK60099.1 unnamed protein product [Paramecium tetraurelia]|eukprot:XP_001427497.1 hypothetical protein (macronuclear) [Paramecium tetraurelia strain d4-2]